MNQHTHHSPQQYHLKPFNNNHASQLSWWVKVATTKPFCIYYFGPFDCQAEAIVAEYGYIEDLQAEKAQGITVEIVTEQPQILTVTDEDYLFDMDFRDSLGA